MTPYQKLLLNFKEHGYTLKPIQPQFQPKNEILLRHDVDFDVQLAHALSQEEDELDIQSTYYFLLRSTAYNPFDQHNLTLIKQMAGKGHHIAIHYDATLYDNLDEGLAFELQLFKLLSDTPIQLISMHRPVKELLGQNTLINGIEHTYMPKYFNEIAYFADSGGSFRYGHPLESEAFSNRDTIQLLTHPIWWIDHEPDGTVEVLEHFRLQKNKDYKTLLQENCIPYKNFIESQ